MKSTEEKIKVMQAYLDGKEIEYTKEHERWISLNIKYTGYPDELIWNWENYDYRIKKEN